MAINPNTDFSAGAVLTAAQQNRFPRGVMAFNSVTTTDSTITTEEVQVTSSAFTAVANRYYRITYYEPGFGSSVAAAMTMRIRQGTTTGGTLLQQGEVYNTGAQQQFGQIVGVHTFSAGSVQLVGTCANSAGTGSATRSSTKYAFILVEDIGPS